MDGSNWQSKLQRIVTFGKKHQVNNFIQNIVQPAFSELAEEFRNNDIEVCIDYTEDEPSRIELIIVYNEIRNFHYDVKIKKEQVSQILTNEDNMPLGDSNFIYLPVTFFKDGSSSYGIKYFTKEQIISDVLKKYERYLSIVSDSDNDLLFIE